MFARKSIGILLIIGFMMVFLGNLLAAEAFEQKDEKPTLSPVRITGEIVGGMFAGLAGGVVVIASIVAVDDKAPSIILGTALATAYALGSTTTVYLIGNIGDQTGSLGATMLGTVMGGVVGIAGGFLIHAVRGDIDHDDLAELFILAVPAVGATIGFNLTRRYESSAISNSQMTRAAPTFRLDLLKVRF